MRYYIPNSSIFDNPENKYDHELFKKTLIELGCKNVRRAHYNGWSNQPKITTFDLAGQDKEKIEKSLSRLPVFKKWGIWIDKKTW